MMSMKKTMAAIFLSVASLTTSVQANYWGSCNDCCLDVTVGVDWLYWSPCTSDRHFALTTDSEDNVKTHYLCDEWDSGVRVYGKLGNLWNGFNGGLIYTYINPKTSGSVEQIGNNGVVFSFGFPSPGEGGGLLQGSRLDAKWELQYQTLDAILSYSIDVTQNRCFKIEAFSGLTWVDVKQKASYTLDQVRGNEIEIRADFDRNNDFWAIGPCFGLNTSFRFCDCFNIFGLVKTSLVVGESKNKDVISATAESGESLETWVFATFTAKDKCFCFPGLHLATGIDYELCLCNITLDLRLGWEYVQWINAPTFPYYELGGSGVRSAPSTNDLTMQGIFLGLNTTF